MSIQEPVEKHQKKEEKKEKEYVQLEFDFDIAKEDNVAPI